MQYQIAGEPLPVVTCQLAAGETMITERGSMSWMTPNMRMETTTNGGLGKAFGRLLAGEALFQNRYTAQGGPGLIAFASSFPGSIRAFEIAPGRELVVQKSGFLAAEAGVELSAGQSLVVDTGYIAAMDATCSVDIVTVPGVKNAFFGGEGLFNTVVTGPGHIWLQTMPISNVAAVLRPFFPSSNN